MVLKPGGPCIICGVTESSNWYGKKGTPDVPGRPVCRSNPCKEAAGYKVKRKRRGGDQDEIAVAVAEELIYSVSEVEAFLGFR